ncbi:MAG: 50S ribosomal protein L19 [Candidatus Paceibacterota bacterium]
MERAVLSPVNISQRKSLDIRSGDTVRIQQRIVETDKKTGKLKTRLQAFEGLIIAVKHGKEAGGTFTVRKIASGVGVEKIFPIYSPMIDSIEVIKRSKVRRAKLYHIRDKAAKEIRRQMRNTRELPDVVSEEDVVLEEEVPVEIEKTEEEVKE